MRPVTNSVGLVLELAAQQQVPDQPIEAHVGDRDSKERIRGRPLTELLKRPPRVHEVLEDVGGYQHVERMPAKLRKFDVLDRSDDRRVVARPRLRDRVGRGVESDDFFCAGRSQPVGPATGSAADIEKSARDPTEPAQYVLVCHVSIDERLCERRSGHRVSVTGAAS